MNGLNLGLLHINNGAPHAYGLHPLTRAYVVQTSSLTSGAFTLAWAALYILSHLLFCPSFSHSISLLSLASIPLDAGLFHRRLFHHGVDPYYTPFHL
jgi:hypothetical protein